MTQDIDDVIRRTYRYYYEDGLVETAVGILFFIIGLSFLGWLTIQSNPPLGVVMVFLSVGLILGGVFFIQKMIPRLKDRLTHPRTGKVVYRREEPQRGNRLVLFTALMVFILTLFLPEQSNQMALPEGGFLGVVLAYLGFRASLPRFYLLGGAALLVGIAAALLFHNDISGSAFTFGGSGLILLISGLIVLNRYLRRYPQVEVADE